MNKAKKKNFMGKRDTAISLVQNTRNPGAEEASISGQ